MGQQSTTLSGGEAQRIKLATELAKRQTGNTLYILDEPTTGLHFEDVKILMDAIHQLVELGNSFIIIDEAQNLSIHELKTIITRVGDNTKIVLTGDIEQIDNTHVDIFTNGLTYAVEKFKDYAIAGHVTLVKGERSALASLASQIL